MASLQGREMNMPMAETSEMSIRLRNCEVREVGSIKAQGFTGPQYIRFLSSFTTSYRSPSKTWETLTNSRRVRVLLTLSAPRVSKYVQNREKKWEILQQWRGTEAGAEATALVGGAEPPRAAASGTTTSLAIDTAKAGRTKTVAHLLLLACSFAIFPLTLGLFSSSFKRSIFILEKILYYYCCYCVNWFEFWML